MPEIWFCETLWNFVKFSETLWNFETKISMKFHIISKLLKFRFPSDLPCRVSEKRESRSASSRVKVKVKWSEEFFCPRFRWKLDHVKFKGSKCAQFWKKWGFFLQNQKKIRFQVWKSGKIYKGFPRKKKLHGNPL